MKIRLLIPVIFAAAALLSGCEKKPAAAATGSPVVARAGDEVITVADVEKEVQRRLAKGVNVPEKSALIQEMLERLAAVASARQANLHADPETKHEMENVLIAKLRAQELETKLAALSVSEEEIRAAYEAGSGQLHRPAKVRLAMLQMQGGVNMSDAKRAELRARMEEALQKAAETPAEGGRGGAANGFGQVAVQYSDDQVSRYRGGDIGWLDEGVFSYHWPKEVLAAGYALEKGQRSDIIESAGNLYVVMKTDRRDGSTTPFAEAQNSLRRDLLAKKRAEIEAAFLAGNRSRTGAEVREEVLSTLNLPAVPARPGAVADNLPPALPGMNSSSR
jgi:peptidyl-prolyl cis-trans isomerase C